MRVVCYDSEGGMQSLLPEREGWDEGHGRVMRLFLFVLLMPLGQNFLFALWCNTGF